jgi:lysophospholipase L1-like esterase
MRILVFGDSIEYGAWDTEGGWVDRLKRIAHQSTVDSEGANKLQIINLGIGGNTSADILARMESEIKARYSKSWPFVFIFSYGTNDERLVDGKVQLTIDQVLENTKNIIETAKKYTDKILFIGCPPLPQESVILKDNEYSDSRIKAYESAIKDVLVSQDIEFVDIRSAFERNSPADLFCYDNIHPNNNGHKIIADTVWPEFERLML